MFIFFFISIFKIFFICQIIYLLYIFYFVFKFQDHLTHKYTRIYRQWINIFMILSFMISTKVHISRHFTLIRVKCTFEALTFSRFWN